MYAYAPYLLHLSNETTKQETNERLNIDFALHWLYIKRIVCSKKLCCLNYETTQYKF